MLDIGRPISVFDEMRPEEVMVRDYLKATAYKSAPLVRVRIREIKVLEQWVYVWHESLRVGAAPRGIVFPMSVFS